MDSIGIGLIGSGFMGKAHAIAYHAAPRVFALAKHPYCAHLAEIDLDTAGRAARAFGFARAGDDWRALIDDPAVQVVDICTPNHLHEPMALAALAAGKHVYLEKPMALNADGARRLRDAARTAGTVTMLGFNYARLPATQLATEMIDAGELGEVRHFRGTHNEDYLADPAVAHSWRQQRALAGSGALGDIGSHIIHLAMHLIGPIAEVSADLATVIPTRPLPGGSTAEVENDDIAHALLRFADGATGSVECSRVHWGRRLGLTYEVVGSKGTLAFDQERPGELHWYNAGDRRGRDGFRTLLIGPEHTDYAPFCPGGGHGLGFNDMKIIEVRDLIEAIAGTRRPWPDFAEGCRVSEVLDTVEAAAADHCWLPVIHR